MPVLYSGVTNTKASAALTVSLQRLVCSCSYWPRRGCFGSSSIGRASSSRSIKTTSKRPWARARSRNQLPTGQPTRPGRVLAMTISSRNGCMADLVSPGPNSVKLGLHSAHPGDPSSRSPRVPLFGAAFDDPARQRARARGSRSVLLAATAGAVRRDRSQSFGAVSRGRGGDPPVPGLPRLLPPRPEPHVPRGCDAPRCRDVARRARPPALLDRRTEPDRHGRHDRHFRRCSR